MAASDKQKYPLGSPQEHIKMCESHDLRIDMICEDCDEFICSKCAKTDHRDHSCNTIPKAADLRRKGLQKCLNKVKGEDLHGIDEKIEKVSKQIKRNKEVCDAEIKKLEKHCDEIIARLVEHKRRTKISLKDNLVKENDQLRKRKRVLEKKRKDVFDSLNFIEKNNSTMSDYSLIDNQRELTKMMSELGLQTKNCEYSLRFTRGEIKDDLLESLVGKISDLDDIGLAQINSFQYGNNLIFSMQAYSEDLCYLREHTSKYTEQVNMEGDIKHRFISITFDMCVTDSSAVYFTDFSNNFISCLSPSGSVSTVVSTDPLVPDGICQSVDGGLLITLVDEKSDLFKLDSNSRRLVRHITLTSDVIHEYDHFIHEDGQTGLFTFPYRVTQNSNRDICVVNTTSLKTAELVIMSPSGRMKAIYRGQNLPHIFSPTDVVCDSLCNILVTDPLNNQIHLLSPDGEFLKFLLTENQVKSPCCLSIHKSTLWVGHDDGFVKVFRYKYAKQ
ncbi:uncharacterized protein LOC134237219 [Saccostrea cucullata]|uniref:uncharacterized protein LOC134237219 n=1 Tax=Saccostrea cuccullata TaxID=36930 RepID=UPI002ED328B8